MKCWKCGNELTTGDAPNSAQCRRCEETRISSSPTSAGSEFYRPVVVGDRYDHATGVYEIDWVCGCGDYDNGKTCVGLRGDAMTWTGMVSQLREAGFEIHTAGLEPRRNRVVSEPLLANSKEETR